MRARVTLICEVALVSNAPRHLNHAMLYQISAAPTSGWRLLLHRPGDGGRPKNAVARHEAALHVEPGCRAA